MNIEVKCAAKSKLSTIKLENLNFGEIFSDHMFIMDNHDHHWESPRIVPFGDMGISPALCSLHYGQIVFEGLKVFPNQEGSLNIFRPQKYFQRLQKSSRRLCIPEMDYESFIKGLTELVKLDQKWVPQKQGESLYIRPFIFATDCILGVHVSKSYRFMIILSPVGAYYKEGLNPVRLITCSEYVRAVKGGLGAAKTPANYAASLLAAEEAKKEGYTQVLWLDGLEHKYIEEVGAMNIFFLIGDELVTPSLDGSILDGVTRDSTICLARDWGIKISERKISMDEVLLASKNGQLKEAFGTGTAAVISPVGEIKHGQTVITINNRKIGELSLKLYEELTGIQYGMRPDKFGWCLKI